MHETLGDGAIKEVVKLTEQGLAAREVGGRFYLPDGLKLVREPLAQVLQTSTLQSIVDYLRPSHQGNVDGIDLFKCMIHVYSPERTSLIGRLDSTRQREELVRAQITYTPFKFNTFMPQEDFIIGLAASFRQTPELLELIKTASSVTDQVSNQTEDDGITQRATVKAGVVRVADVAVKPRVMLAPHRTFMEVEQPASEFIFRIRPGAAQGPVGFALFEADSGAWKAQAIKNVADFFRAKDLKVAVLA